MEQFAQDFDGKEALGRLVAVAELDEPGDGGVEALMGKADGKVEDGRGRAHAVVGLFRNLDGQVLDEDTDDPGASVALLCVVANR